MQLLTALWLMLSLSLSRGWWAIVLCITWVPSMGLKPTTLRLNVSCSMEHGQGGRIYNIGACSDWEWTVQGGTCLWSVNSGIWARPASHETAWLVSCGEAWGTQQVKLSKTALVCAYIRKMIQSLFQSFMGRTALKNIYIFLNIFSVPYTTLICLHWRLSKCWCLDDYVVLITCTWQDILLVGLRKIILLIHAYVV